MNSPYKAAKYSKISSNSNGTDAIQLITSLLTAAIIEKTSSWGNHKTHPQ